MLPQNHRFSSPKDFRFMRQAGRSFTHPYFFFIVARAGNNDIQCAVSIAVRVSKKATVRNRLRRQISAILFHTLPQIKPGHRILIIARPNLLGRSFQEINEAVLGTARRARILL